MISRGRCSFCGETYSASAIGRHLESCDKRRKLDPTLQQKTSGEEENIEKATSSSKIVHLVVKGSNGLSMYWMHLDVDSNSTLKQLDAFLRGTWVECCGHLSQFITDDETTNAYEPDRQYRDRIMNARMGSALNQSGMEFKYEYDFGTTTSLDLRVVSIREAGGNSQQRQKKESVKLLARNDPPEIYCGSCSSKKLATNVCSECIWDSDKAWVCDDCSKKHKCGEEMLLPVVNSPRVGMCGYTG